MQAIARLHTEHRQDAAGLQRAVEGLTRFLSRPRAAAALAVVAALWIGANLALRTNGLAQLDALSTETLQVATGLGALFMTIFILITQRREDELSELREQLTLELAILGEQKAAKLIQLVEELRRDLPSVHNRVDAEARSLEKPADPEAVLEALREQRDDA
ncbi:MAG TPA: DUF1003 domain-containing protein [Caulobacteraceae bacterium]